MRKIKKYIIQKNDIKSLNWAKSAKENDIDIIPQSGSPIKAPFFLIKYLINNSKPKGYIVRYLNDYPSFVKTILRFFSEILLIILSKIFNINLYWICHNVDKESNRSFTKLSKVRRNMFAKFSKKIFVTDELLVAHAQKYFPKYKNKIEAISFGVLNISNNHVSENEVEAKKFINTFKTDKKKLVLFCAGSPDSEKSLHFNYLTKLIDTVTIYEILAVVAGNFDNSLRCNNLLNEYKKHPNIIIFTSFIEFSNDFVKDYVDFYFRAYDDFSVPFTVYEAASFKKPTLVLEDYGFVPEMITKYELGTTFSFKDNINLNNRINELFEVDIKNYEFFLELHNWSKLGLALEKIK